MLVNKLWAKRLDEQSEVQYVLIFIVRTAGKINQYMKADRMVSSSFLY